MKLSNPEKKKLQSIIDAVPALKSGEKDKAISMINREATELLESLTGNRKYFRRII